MYVEMQYGITQLLHCAFFTRFSYCFQRVLAITILSVCHIDVLYNCAKFGADCFGDSGATVFLQFLHGPSPIHIYKDDGKTLQAELKE